MKRYGMERSGMESKKNLIQSVNMKIQLILPILQSLTENEKIINHKVRKKPKEPKRT